jgi:hypothetical protein
MAESGLFTVFAWSVALIATYWFDVGGPFEFIAKASSLLFALLGLISLMRFLYGFLKLSEIHESSRVLQPTAPPQSLRNAAANAALPPQTTPILSDYPLRSNTKEMLSRQSVTENTTKLLDQDTV